MLQSIPLYMTIGFIITTLFTLIFLYNLIRNSCLESQKTGIFVGMAIWMALQGYLSYIGFYSQHLDTMPPRFIFVLGPPLLLMLLLFLTPWGRKFIDSLSLSTLTYLHVIRIPVELVLFGLFIYKAIPELMTFEGRNFDILAGITAPLVAYLGVQQGKMGKMPYWSGTSSVWPYSSISSSTPSFPSPLLSSNLPSTNPILGYCTFPLSGYQL